MTVEQKSYLKGYDDARKELNQTYLNAAEKLEQSLKAEVDGLFERLKQTNEVLQIHANIFGNSDTATKQIELNNEAFSKHHKTK